MELEDAIMNRRSIRRFKKDDVPQETVERLLELASAAPSAGNLQARDFIVVREEKLKKELMAASLNQKFVYEAPVSIVVTANMDRTEHYGHRGRSLYCIQDSAAAIQNLLLAVHAEGLGAVWVGAFKEEMVSESLNLPKHARPIAIIPIGHPDEAPMPRRRIPLTELVHYEKW
jgi:nitroreductase